MARAVGGGTTVRVRLGGGEGVSLSSRRSGDTGGSRSSSPRGALLGRLRVAAGVRRERGGVGCRAAVHEVVRSSGVVSSGMASMVGLLMIGGGCSLTCALGVGFAQQFPAFSLPGVALMPHTPSKAALMLATTLVVISPTIFVIIRAAHTHTTPLMMQPSIF